MTVMEELIQQAADSGAEVIERRFKSERIKGLYCDGIIAVSDRLETSAEEVSILAEEIGHHLTASGDILDQSRAGNRKQEQRGRMWAYDRLIGLSGIVRAYRRGCRNRYEMAEELGVTEELLAEALERYRQKYGICTRYEGCVIFWEPLGVMEVR